MRYQPRGTEPSSKRRNKASSAAPARPLPLSGHARSIALTAKAIRRRSVGRRRARDGVVLRAEDGVVQATESLVDLLHPPRCLGIVDEGQVIFLGGSEEAHLDVAEAGSLAEEREESRVQGAHVRGVHGV